MNSLPTIPLFPAGQIVATPGALALLEQAKRSPLEFLSRHLSGDWGALCQDDKTENELSLKQGFRLLSSYRVSEAQTLWIITEADRSVTTLLLPMNTEQQIKAPARQPGFRCTVKRPILRFWGSVS